MSQGETVSAHDQAMAQPQTADQPNVHWGTLELNKDSHNIIKVNQTGLSSSASLLFNQKSLETVFSIAICRQSGQIAIEKLFLTILDPRSSIVKSVFERPIRCAKGIH